MADSTLDREPGSRLADLTVAVAAFRAAFVAVPGPALSYRPAGEDYALGGLADHVATVARNYATLLRALVVSNGPLIAPADALESPALARRIRNGATSAERDAVDADVVAAHEALAEVARAFTAESWSTPRPVTYAGSAEPYATAPADVIGWVVDHDHAHVRHVAELLARREAGVAPGDTAIRALLDAFNGAWNGHDLDGALALCTDDCLFENTTPPPDGGHAVGREALRAAWEPIFANPASHFESEEALVCGDRAVVRWRYSWGSGSVRGVDVIEVREGKVAAKRTYVKG